MPQHTLFRLIAAVALLLAACATQTQTPTPTPTPTLSIRGQVALPGPIEPAPDAQWVLELRDETTGQVLAELRLPLRASPSPQPFELRLERGRLLPGHPVALRAALLMQGWAQWLSAPLVIDPGRADIDVGTLPLASAARPLAFQSTLDCGHRRFIVGMAGHTLRLLDGEMAHDLQAAPTAPDGRHEAVGDSSTYVWTQGPLATVSLRGEVYRGCRVQRGAGPG